VLRTCVGRAGRDRHKGSDWSVVIRRVSLRDEQGRSGDDDESHGARLCA